MYRWTSATSICIELTRFIASHLFCTLQGLNEWNINCRSRPAVGGVGPTAVREGASALTSELSPQRSISNSCLRKPIVLPDDGPHCFLEKGAWPTQLVQKCGRRRRSGVILIYQPTISSGCEVAVLPLSYLWSVDGRLIGVGIAPAFPVVTLLSLGLLPWPSACAPTDNFTYRL